MSSKRTASSDLNHENWDQEDEIEESGSFTRAPSNVLKNRVIKVAKRRNPVSSSTESNSGGLFSSFGGFSSTTKPVTPNFGFLKSLNASSGTKTNGLTEIPIIDLTDSTSTSTPTVSNTFEIPTSSTKSTSETSSCLKKAFYGDSNTVIEKPSSWMKATSTASKNAFKIPDNKSIDSSNGEKETKRPVEYYAKLKGLNQSVSNWIKKHVDTNPFLNLTPIFRDYEKHLGDLESNYPENKTSLLNLISDKTVNQSCETIKPITTNSIFDTFLSKQKKDGDTPKKVSDTPKKVIDTPKKVSDTPKVDSDTPKKEDVPKADDSSTKKLPFTFVLPAASTNFFFGNTATTTSSSLFKYGNGAPNTTTPFTFTSVATSSKTDSNPVPTSTSIENNDDEEPPKNDFTPVIEEGHIYTIRCKVFVRKDGQFSDRGVGNLFLKPIPDSEKVQLIVRADTNLGNLLCNFILSSTIPMQRMGKKDVMLACLPSPESKPPPVPILFRVKSPEEADELLKILEKHKN